MEDSLTPGDPQAVVGSRPLRGNDDGSAPGVSEDPNTDLIGYVFKVDGGTGTVTGSAPWDSNYVKIWVIRRNIDYYCRDCDLYTDETIQKDNCPKCGLPLEAEEADPDERILGWETVRSAGLVRRHKETA